MLKIYDVETACKTILRRDLLRGMDYPPSLLASIEQVFGSGATPESAVRQILTSIRERGDEALAEWSTTLDGTHLEQFRLPQHSLRDAWQKLPNPLIEAMTAATDRIRAFHEHQPLSSWSTGDLGGTLGQRISPIQRVGVYVPGGSAPLPSSLLMSVIPAQVAGVEQIVVCTPPEPHPTILSAAHLCGMDALFQVGGAQAIGAMTFGTESIPRVDKIVGAGNIFVTLAKQQVFGLVGLDGLAGPTETMIIADSTSNPNWVAADLLAQAEHDPLASAILLTPDPSLADRVVQEIEVQLENLSRSEIILQSLSRRGGIVLTPDLQTAADLANQYASEHLCLSVADPERLASAIHNAGGLFLGEHSCEVLGDYIAGPSHIMPTGGTARFASPLNVLDFVKITSVIGLDSSTSQSLAPQAFDLANAETLTAHAAAAACRTE
jgi:histidinol dehydrogenase